MRDCARQIAAVVQHQLHVDERPARLARHALSISRDADDIVALQTRQHSIDQEEVVDPCVVVDEQDDALRLVPRDVLVVYLRKPARVLERDPMRKAPLVSEPLERLAQCRGFPELPLRMPGRAKELDGRRGCIRRRRDGGARLGGRGRLFRVRAKISRSTLLSMPFLLN